MAVNLIIGLESESELFLDRGGQLCAHMYCTLNCTVHIGPAREHSLKFQNHVIIKKNVGHRLKISSIGAHMTRRVFGLIKMYHHRFKMI